MATVVNAGGWVTDMDALLTSCSNTCAMDAQRGANWDTCPGGGSGDRNYNGEGGHKGGKSMSMGMGMGHEHGGGEKGMGGEKGEKGEKGGEKGAMGKKVRNKIIATHAHNGRDGARISIPTLLSTVSACPGLRAV